MSGVPRNEQKLIEPGTRAFLAIGGVAIVIATAFLGFVVSGELGLRGTIEPPAPPPSEQQR